MLDTMQRCVLIGMNSFVMTIVTVELRRRRRRPRTRDLLGVSVSLFGLSSRNRGDVEYSR